MMASNDYHDGKVDAAAEIKAKFEAKQIRVDEDVFYISPEDFYAIFSEYEQEGKDEKNN